MFPEKLVKEQNFATKLFSAAIESNKLAHAFMFTRAQAVIQYDFALNLAKLLNCQNKIDDKACNTCTNCKWINNNSHPAVITVTPVDFIPEKGELSSDNKSRTRNEIKVNQAALLQKELLSSSKYHRVIIFMGAKEEKLPPETIESLWLGFKSRVKPPENIEGRENWVPMHLNYQSFPARTANILLKTLEEPNAKVTFIFITKDTDDMLNTIVSRCQTVPLERGKELIFDEEDYLQEIKTYFPPRNELDCINTAKSIIEFSKKEGFSLESILEYVANNYKNILLHNIEQGYYYPNIPANIQEIENTKKMIKNYVNPQSALISMLNTLIEK